MTTTHTIADAIAIASDWISETNLPFSAAFIGGSVAYAADDSPYDPAADIDCYLIVNGDPPAGKIGKLAVNGVLLDVSWIPWSALEHAESDAVLASLLNFGRVVIDDGNLGNLQQTIKRYFVTSEAITKRIDSIQEKIRNGLAVDSSHLSQPEQVMNWIFPATLITHVSLVMSCSPLTVRKRFLSAKTVMPAAQYEHLLNVFTFDTVTRPQAQHWLDTTARVFDATAELAATSSRFWSTDIQQSSRHIAIDGSQQLIDAGDHREALFWIIVTSARCLTVREDAGMTSLPYLMDFWKMLDELYMETTELRQMKTDAILKMFVW